MATASDSGDRKRVRKRTQDPDGVKRDILAAASEAFVRDGYAGARIDEIAARTRSSKRMIYYYFGGKEALYIAVLEAAYRHIRTVEAQLDLDRVAPEAALAELVGFTFDYQTGNPNFIRLVMIENVHEAAFLKRSAVIREVNVSVIDALGGILTRGAEAGIFRKDLKPVDIYMTISALCVFMIANRGTFSTIFDIDMTSRKALAARRQQVVETVERYVRA